MMYCKKKYHTNSELLYIVLCQNTIPNNKLTNPTSSQHVQAVEYRVSSGLILTVVQLNLPRASWDCRK